MKLFNNIELKFSNWNKKSPIIFSHIANGLILFQAMVIPTIATIPMEFKAKAIVISTVSIVTALVKFIQKLTAEQETTITTETIDIKKNDESVNQVTISEPTSAPTV